MFLPEHNQLDIGKLSSVFRDTTNSYKFYWFLSILDSLRDNGENIISQKDIALRMLANVWYPLDYFKLSFGSQDGFKKVAQFVSSKILVDNSPNSPSLIDQIKQNFTERDLTQLTQEIKKLYRWVPFRFVSPFIEAETKGILDQYVNAAITQICDELFESHPHRIMYRFVGDSIELNSIWVEYLQKHQGILRGFIFWHLVRFVQKNNPNVIGLSEKLQKPVQRDLGLANKFWRSYLNSNPNCTCIYSGQVITSENLSLDHFLPWSYVAHDQLWNIIPTTRKVNSTKSRINVDRIVSKKSFIYLTYSTADAGSFAANLCHKGSSIPPTSNPYTTSTTFTPTSVVPINRAGLSEKAPHVLPA